MATKANKAIAATAFSYSAMIARLENTEAEASKRLLPTFEAGANDTNPFADMASELSVVQDMEQALNAGGRMFFQSALDGEISQQGKARAFVFFAKTLVRLGVDPTSDDLKAKIKTRLWPTHKESSQGTMLSHLVTFFKAEKAGTLDATVASVYATHCAADIVKRQSLHNSLYSALAAQRAAVSKEDRKAGKFAPLTSEMVQNAVVPPGKAPAKRTAPAEATWDARAASAAAACIVDVHCTDDVEKILTIIRTRLEAALPKTAPGPVTNANALSTPAK